MTHFERTKILNPYYVKPNLIRNNVSSWIFGLDFFKIFLFFPHLLPTRYTRSFLNLKKAKNLQWLVNNPSRFKYYIFREALIELGCFEYCQWS
jgi:hypothetical protein